MYALGFLRASGVIGVDASTSFDSAWYRKAADCGVVGAQYELGEMLRFSSDIAAKREAVVYLENAKNAGHPRAAKQLKILNRTLERLAK